MDKTKYQRPSDNVEVRSPDDPVDQQFFHDLRNKRALMSGLLNEPQNIWRREEMEAWLKNPMNDPDYNPGGSSLNENITLPKPIDQLFITAEAEGKGQPVKPMPEITAGTGMDRRTAKVDLTAKPSKSQSRLPAMDEYHGLADSEVPE